MESAAGFSSVKMGDQVVSIEFFESSAYKVAIWIDFEKVEK